MQQCTVHDRVRSVQPDTVNSNWRKQFPPVVIIYISTGCALYILKVGKSIEEIPKSGIWISRGVASLLISSFFFFFFPIGKITKFYISSIRVNFHSLFFWDSARCPAHGRALELDGL